MASLDHITGASGVSHVLSSGAPTTGRARSRSGELAVLVAGVGFGLNPFFATKAFHAGVTPIAASFVRVLVVMVVLAPFAPKLRGWARQSLIMAGAGAMSMLGFAGYFIALDRAPVAAATVVYYTYPIVVLVLSSLVWRRRMHPWEGAVCVVVLLGVVLAVGPVGISGALLVALAPAAAAPIGWAIYLLVLSSPAALMPTIPKVFAGSVGGVVILLPFAVWQTGGRIMPFTTEAVSAMGWLTLCTLAIPAVLVTWGASHAGERATAMIGSFEFVVAMAAGWLLLGDGVSPTQIWGIGLVLMAVMFAARKQSMEG
jgi:drug/metabolite transporter (DMT)-like permease